MREGDAIASALIKVDRSRVIATLVAARKKHEDAPDVVVGYSAPYAVFVHENLEAHHPNGKAKFLSDPARRLSVAIAEKVAHAIRRGLDWSEAQLIGGYFLLRASQRECPVRTGFLRASGFVRLR